MNVNLKNFCIDLGMNCVGGVLSEFFPSERIFKVPSYLIKKIFAENQENLKKYQLLAPSIVAGILNVSGKYAYSRIGNKHLKNIFLGFVAGLVNFNFIHNPNSSEIITLRYCLKNFIKPKISDSPIIDNCVLNLFDCISLKIKNIKLSVIIFFIECLTYLLLISCFGLHVIPATILSSVNSSVIEVAINHFY